MMNKTLTIKDKKYLILEEDTSDHRKIYIIQDENKIIYRLLIEDYREASFMFDKFYSAYINPRGDGSLKTINPTDIKINR